MKSPLIVLIASIAVFTMLGCGDKSDKNIRNLIKKDIDIMVQQSQDSYSKKDWGTIQLGKLSIELLDKYREANGNFIYSYKVKALYVMKYKKNLNFDKMVVHAGDTIKKEETYGYKVNINSFGQLNFEDVKPIDIPHFLP